MTYKQYDIVIVNLDPTIGHEIRKTRPCLIVSPDEMNRHLGTIIVCPITSQSKAYPTRVPFRLDGHENWVVLDQIRTIDKTRITKRIGQLGRPAITALKRVFKATFVDD